MITLLRPMLSPQLRSLDLTGQSVGGTCDTAASAGSTEGYVSTHALEGRDPGRGLEGNGRPGSLTLPWRRGADPELRRRQTCGREAGLAPGLEAGDGD